jgi:hypothetical protein
MSKGRDFEEFMRSARGSGAARPGDASRIAEKLRGRVEWNRALPSAVAEALKESPANAANPQEPGGSVGAEVSANGASSSVFGWMKLVGGIASIAILGVAAYAVVTTSSTNDRSPVPSAPLAASSSAPATDAVGTKVVAPETAAPSDVVVVADPSLLPTAPAPSVPAAAPHASASGGSLDAEVALLAQTSAALRAHDPSRALALAEEHGRRFPNGALGPEFAAEHILALSALGRKTEACSEARRFIELNTSSPLLPQVRAACDEITPRP